MLAFTPLPGLIATYAAPTQRTQESILMKKWAQIYSRFNEALSVIMTLKSYAMEDSEKKRFLDNVKEANTTMIRGVH